MADPLSVLRHYCTTKKEIIERDDQIIFGEFSWPQDVKTNYLKYGSGKKGVPPDYYSLKCLLYLLKNLHIQHSVYVRQCATEDIPVVNRPDRKDLLAYLTGKTSTSASIDKDALLPKQWDASVENDEANVDSSVSKVFYKDMAKQIGHKLLTESAYSSIFSVPEQHMLQSERPKSTAETTSTQLEIPAPLLREQKQLLADRLDANKKESAINVDDIKPLSKAMSVEKIASIKAKRMSTKRTVIKSTDNDDGMSSGLRAILDFDVNATRGILSHERQWRTRETILQSHEKTFAKNVFDIFKSIEIRERGIVPHKSIKKPEIRRHLPLYNRYDQEKLNQQKEVMECVEMDGFQIDTMGTYQGMSLKSVAESVSHRKESCSSRPVRNEALPKGPECSLSTPKIIIPPTRPTPTKRPSRMPIIIIPAVTTSLITMYNAADILLDLKYVTTEEKKAQCIQRDKEVLLQRQKDGNITVPYCIVDIPQKLRAQDWQRVVAVFITGQTWQFKGWPWNGNPVEIFANICAFHLHYDDMPVDANVIKWAVTVLSVSRHKRHLDKAILRVFWEKLDKFMTINKPFLRF